MKKQLEITEGISSVWHFHLSENGAFTRSLCGKQTMRTNMKLSQWGMRSSHIRETYCEKCAELGGMNSHE